MNMQMDNLAAILVGGILILSMIHINSRTQQQLTESAAFHAMMKQSDNLIQMMRRDMQGMEEALQVSVSGSGKFEFNGYLGTSTTRVKIGYEAVVVDTIYVRDAQGDVKTDAGGMPLETEVYQILREVDDVPSGGSADIFTEWSIYCRVGSEDDEAEVVADAADCEHIDVSFEAVPRLGSTKSVSRLSWSTIFTPPLLSVE